MAASNSSEQVLSLGDVVGDKYHVVRTLGSGGMGIVYAAKRLTLDDIVALKCILAHRDNPANRTRFIREARAAARIRHPNVVRIFDFGELDGSGTPYMVMEYLDGPTLATVMAAPQASDLERALAIFGQVCAAIEAGHRRGVVHRDIKPGNVILDQADDGRETVKVLDFGLAHILQAQADQSSPGMLVGTVDYMSPEQVAGEPVSPASDVFSLGTLLYELVTHRPAFRAESAVATLMRITEGSYEPPRAHAPDLPDTVVEAIAAALQTEPGARPRSALELATMAGAPVVGLEPTPMAAERRAGASIESRPTQDSGQHTDVVAAPKTATRRTQVPRDPGLIGRDEQLQIVERELEASTHSPGRVVLITGGIGLGKSRLLDAIAERVSATGAHLVRGRFFAYEGDRPPPHEVLAWMLDGDAPGKRPGAVAPDSTDKWKLFDELAKRLRESAASATLVVILDDLQWASSLDLEFLAYLPHALVDHPLLVVVSARPELERAARGGSMGELPPALRSFVDRLNETRRLRPIALAPLSGAQTHALLRGTFGQLRIRPQDVRRIQHVASGNPFVLGELVRDLVDRGRIRPEGDGWACDDLYDVGLPDSVQALVAHRLDELDADLRSVLEVACVVGEDFRFETVMAAGDFDEAQLEDQLARAVARGVLTDRDLSPGSDFRFSSAAIHAVLYDRLSPRRRRRLHRQVIEALQSLYASDGARMAGVLAYHHHAVDDWAPALQHALMAARRCLDSHDVDGTRRAVEQALEASHRLVDADTPPTDDQRVRLEFLGGSLANRVGQLAEAAARLQRAVDGAEALGDRWLMLDALLGIAECHLGRGSFEDGVEAGRRAQQVALQLGDERRELFARIRISACAGPLGRFDEGLQAIAPVLATTDPAHAAIRAMAWREQAWLRVKQGAFGEAEQAARRALDEARHARDPMATYRAVSALGMVHAECGDHREGVERLSEALELARALSLRRREGIELANIGECHFLLGELDRAVALTRQALAIFVEIGDRASEGDCRVNVGRMLRQRGRRDEALAMLDRGREACAAAGRIEYEGIALCELGELREEGDEPVLARALFEEAAERLGKIGAFVRWRATFGLARVAARLGEAANARSLAADARAQLERQLSQLPAGVDATSLMRSLARVDQFTRHEIDDGRSAPASELAEVDRDALDRQHRDLEALAGELLSHLDSTGQVRDVDAVIALIEAFTDRLRAHAHTETAGLYPRLLGHEDASIRAKARELYTGGLGLYDSFFAFRNRWPGREDIAADPTRFAKDVVAVVRLLGERMHREEAELHPLAEPERQ